MDQLQRDREQLARRAKMPSWFHPVLGLIAAGFVIAPALPSAAGRNTSLMFTLIAIVFLIYKAQKTTGIKVRHSGLPASLVTLSLTAIILTGFSITLGLVSFHLNWWSILPGLAVFAAVVLISRFYEGLTLDRLSHGR